MSNQKRFIMSVLSVLVAGSLLAGCNSSDEQSTENVAPPVRPVKTVIANAVTPSLERTYSAVLVPSQIAELSFRLNGRIIELPIRDGANVKKGDVIARLDPRDAQAKVSQIESQLAQANEKLIESKSGARAEDVATAKADVSAAKAKLDGAIQQVARTMKLFKRQIISRSKLDKDRTEQRVAKAAYVAKKQALKKSKAGARKEDVAAQEAAIRGIESQLENAKENLADTTLRAPFDGIIASRKVENFSNVQANSAIATLQNLKSLDAVFDVPAPDVAVLARAKKLNLSVTLEGIPGKSFDATRKEFSTQADVATQTYRGRVTITDLGKTIVLPGMTGTLTITAPQNKAGVYKLPVVALASTADGKPFVWIVEAESHKMSKRPVVTGEIAGGDIIILEGLSDGDIIATAGISALQDGMIVNPVAGIGE